MLVFSDKDKNSQTPSHTKHSLTSPIYLTLVGPKRTIRDVTLLAAWVASVSVWFQSKERPRDRMFGFYHARNGTRATRPRSFFRAIFARSLTLVPCSLLRYRKETLATQPSIWSIIHLLCACTIYQWKTIIIVLSCLYVA